MLSEKILPPDLGLEQALQNKIDQKTKPLGALGNLEALALKIGLIQQTLTPELKAPHLLVFAADHGVALDGVSAFPQEVTYQMVMNFLGGGAAINVFCRQNGLGLTIVDAGVKGDFEGHNKPADFKIAHGTQNFVETAAMTAEQCSTALEHGREIVKDLFEKGSNVIGFGEMGIGNTSSASLLMSVFCDLPLTECVGRGTGLTDTQLQHKQERLTRALEFHQLDRSDPLKVMEAFGGFEIVMMAGSMLAAAERKMIVLVDGFIASAALLAAYQLNKNILQYAVFCHESAEQGHQKILKYLGGKALLKLDLRLGEGTGCALAYPLLQSAVQFLNDMASFESAGVSEKKS
ncbi:nicotinate-nucleotide--dimethylbenzimidazole phosphoribosyltransferase [Fulvivirga sp. M361]|uniref:nicotinate-nucleotide--dimethylbenzimidazole phosphoribosyltransferase n=1 Tax=Fulvivirga sp. M361 TaxID=2594266 RepID=UPI00117A0C6E|nr:nicotinate-nucleotide--dimethylbenzimidazole phosphoribosyltransferase [Fulvivirga sp. M361]TRX55529.1 nicotinate-nucleotide--dimethylbenzimidazole phosphoribosyltransferase [Fulvivirga sp. M361]